MIDHPIFFIIIIIVIVKVPSENFELKIFLDLLPSQNATYICEKIVIRSNSIVYNKVNPP